jgi:alpha-aminoadipate carrier protein LysW
MRQVRNIQTLLTTNLVFCAIGHLTATNRDSKSNEAASSPEHHTPRQPVNLLEAAMLVCPECESEIDVDVVDLDEGEIISCTECATDFEVVGVEPLELAPVADEDDDDDDEDEEEEEE